MIELHNIKGKKSYPLGQEIMQNATAGTIKELTYWWPVLGQTSRWRRSPSTQGSEIKTAVSATTRNSLPELSGRGGLSPL
jgi:hypothetical protein